MNYDYSQTDLSKGILSGLFAGLIAIAANIVFVIAFRSATAICYLRVIVLFLCALYESWN